ncbi:MAG TPA: LLM class flavin-dependent oxidoreductase [Candidatus Limnocylindria bacterium]|nr:LLM class flavin-dependent oxidoreductase [Candidatus Limnocylindria bacterium]
MSRIGIALGAVHDRPFDEVVAFARLAEECGYDAIFVPEAWGRDAFVTLGALARATERIGLGTGIVNVYSRTPALLAMAAVTLDELSGGRAILGLGASGRRVIEGWHGVPMARPLRRLRETTEAVRAIVSGSRRGYIGETLSVAPGFAVTLARRRDRIPIYHASLTARAIRQCAEVADGWLPYFASPETLRADLMTIENVLRAAGRERSSFTVAPLLPAIVTDDEAGARAILRRHLAFYIGGMGRFYREAVASHGFAGVAEEVRRLWDARQRDAAAEAVTDELLDAFAIVGDASRCRARVDDFRAAGADVPVVAIPGDVPLAEAERTVRALGETRR